MKKYRLIFTAIGLAKLANAQATQNKLDITHMAIGDANDEPYMPTGEETALVNEVWRTIAVVKIHEKNANWLEVEAVIPAEVGGFTVNEFGLYDADGDFVAISNHPSTIKPILEDGSLMDLTISADIKSSNAALIELTADPTVITASKGYVDEKIVGISDSTDQKFDQVSTQLAQTVHNRGTVANMKADRRLKAGMLVQTNCYRYIFDGGQGQYRIVDNPELVDDGGSVHDLVNGLKAQLICEKNKVNIKQFGAYGGSGWQDDTIPILNAARYVNTLLADARNGYWGGGELYFPAGVYVCKQDVYLNINVRVRGDGARAWKHYQGKDTLSIIRFQDFVDRYTAAIKVVGYLQDGSVPQGYGMTVEQSDHVIMPADNFHMHDIGIESYGDLKISVGLNLINGTTARLKNVSITGFKYSIIANCSWGSSFENLFSISTLGAILYTRSNVSCSISDSYITVSNNLIAEGESVDDFIRTMPHPNRSFGIFAETAYLEIRNTIIERADISLVAINSKVNITAMTNERISTSVIDAVDSNVSLDGYWIWNEGTNECALLKAINSNVTLKNIDTKKYARVIDADVDSHVSVINAKKTSDFLYNNETTAKVVTNDRTSSAEITLAEGVSNTWVANNANKYAYRQNKQVFFNLRCYTDTARAVGTEFLVGQLPIGYRPSFEIVQYTKNGTLRITASGAIYFNPSVSTTYILADLINYTLT